MLQWFIRFPAFSESSAHLENTPFDTQILRLFEFSLNDFPWIQWIQWITTKSKGSMVTRDILYLTIDTFLDIVAKNSFHHYL